MFLTSMNTSVTPKNGHSKHTKPTFFYASFTSCQDRPSVEQILTRARELVTWCLKMDESKKGDSELGKPNMWRFLMCKNFGRVIL